MKIGIFGGSFNPIHNGHLSLCNQIQSLYNFDKMLLIPTNIPPHKPSVFLASNLHRLNMLKIATKDIDYIEIDDIEFNLKGKSYTYNTVMQLKQKYKDSDFYLIIGADMFLTFNEWYKYSDLLEEVSLIVGSRKQSQYNSLIKTKQQDYKNNVKITIANINVIDVSSTQIRNAIQKNDNAKNSLPKGVYDYIIANKLYL